MTAELRTGTPAVKEIGAKPRPKSAQVECALAHFQGIRAQVDRVERALRAEKVRLLDRERMKAAVDEYRKPV